MRLCQLVKENKRTVAIRRVSLLLIQSYHYTSPKNPKTLNCEHPGGKRSIPNPNAREVATWARIHMEACRQAKHDEKWKPRTHRRTVQRRGRRTSGKVHTKRGTVIGFHCGKGLSKDNSQQQKEFITRHGFTHCNCKNKFSSYKCHSQNQIIDPQIGQGHLTSEQ